MKKNFLRLALLLTLSEFANQKSGVLCSEWMDLIANQSSECIRDDMMI